MNLCGRAVISLKMKTDQKAGLQRRCLILTNGSCWIWGVISEEEGLAKDVRPSAGAAAGSRKAVLRATGTEYCMWKIDAMETLVRELKAKGYGLYICSNASIRLPSVCMDVIPAAECFDGMLFSAEIKYLKPQKEMYEHLF